MCSWLTERMSSESNQCIKPPLNASIDSVNMLTMRVGTPPSAFPPLLDHGSHQKVFVIVSIPLDAVVYYEPQVS